MRTLSIVLLATIVAATSVIACWGLLVSESQHDALARMETASGERVIDLPEDGSLYHLSVVVHDDYRQRPVDRRIVRAFGSDPTLLSLRAQCAYHAFTPSDEEYQQKIKPAVPGVPAVVVQGPSGAVLYASQGPKCLSREDELCGAMRGLFRRFRENCPGPNCPQQQYQESPPPELQTEIVVQEQPIIENPQQYPVKPVTPSPIDDFPWPIFIAVVLLTAVVTLVFAVAISFKKAVGPLT